jgi:hypothetical protein
VGVSRLHGGATKRTENKRKSNFVRKNERCVRSWGVNYGDFEDIKKRFGYSFLNGFSAQKYRSKERGIPFKITLKEWVDLWVRSGQWPKRGKKSGDFVMARNKDKGGYEVGNVRICTTLENRLEYLNRRYGKKNLLP